MASIETVKRRVRGLLAVAAEGSGATEPERATAKRLAEALMAKYGLNETDIPKNEVARPQPAPPPPPQFYGCPVIIVNFDFDSGFGGCTNSTTGTTSGNFNEW